QEITFTSTNDGGSQKITQATTATAPGSIAANTLEISVAAAQSTAGTLVGSPIADSVSQTARSSLVAQYNQIIQQITTTAQASAFGANLSIVQIRQDFSKNLINVLQTGSSNLTLADSNEEAANSQALSTRQSIAVSALSLANQSNQSVLQLLR